MTLPNKNPLGYMGLNERNPPELYFRNRNPTAADYKIYSGGDIWINTVLNEGWLFIKKTASAGTWAGMAGVGAVETLTGNVGGAVGMDAAENINIVGVPGTNGINIRGTPLTNTLTVEMSSPFVGDFHFTNATVGATRTLTVDNNAVHIASHSIFLLETEPLAGDPYVRWHVNGATNFAMGIDNSDSDRFRFRNEATIAIGGNEIFMVDTAVDTFWFYQRQKYQLAVAAGGDVITRVQNADNTNVNSNAYFVALSGGTTSGDAYYQTEIPGSGHQFSWGMDNSDTDNFKLTDGDSPSLGTEFMELDVAASRWNFPVNVFIQSHTNAGGGVYREVQNLDNVNPNSLAYFSATSGAANGDPFILFTVGAVTNQYSVGIDNSDADKFKITTGASPSAGTDLFTMSTVGLITLNNDLDVTEGGTGVSTFTQYGVLIGAAGGDLQVTAAGTTGQFLSAVTGGNPVWTTSAFPVACAIGDVIYGSALNVYSNLAFDNTATRYLANTGGGATVPAWSQIELTNGVSGILPVGNGGIGIANPTDHALLVGSGAAAMTALAVLGNGELAIGSAGADPVPASLTQPAAGLTITGGAGSITFALANDLAALEGIAGTGIAVRTAANTWTTRSLAAPAAGFTITNANGVAGNPTFVLADDLAAVEGIGTTGVVSRTGANTWATSTITQNSLVYGNATQGLTNLGTLTHGQLAIGSTGAAPVASTITAGANITVTNAAGSITIAAAGGGGGLVAQQVRATSTATGTSAAVVPPDSTIPQKTEGVEYITLAITPTNASNILIIEFTTWGGLTSGDEIITSLFQDATANALNSSLTHIANNDSADNVVLRHIMVAGTTSSTTFKIRFGPGHAAHTAYYLRYGNGSTLGGVSQSNLTITEIEV